MNQSCPKGAFTPGANYLHVKSMQRRDRQTCCVNGANYAARIERLGRLTCYSRELKNLNFGGYSRRVNQSGACSSSDVIMSGGRKSQTTMEDLKTLRQGHILLLGFRTTLMKGFDPLF